jgi:hypothetical protein
MKNDRKIQLEYNKIWHLNENEHVKYKFVIVEKIENKKIFHFINVVLLLFTHVYSITQYFVLIINLCSFFTFVLNIDLCPICYQIFSLYIKKKLLNTKKTLKNSYILNFSQ